VRPRVVIVVLAVVAAVALLTFGLISKGNSRIGIGETAPTATLPNLETAGDGSIDQYRGKWILVNFWASWCVPCHDEAPALEKFQKEHAGKDFTVVGIDTQDLSDDGRRFVKEFGIGYPQLHDGNGDFSHEFGTTGVPENFLIAPDGKVRQLQPGPVDAQILEERFAPLLPESKS
jgi:cytochrome c biogenesis protein CcmG, thiol:disulfide interchange protein DsbE